MNENLVKLIEVNKFDLEIEKFNPIIEEKKAPIYEKESEKASLQKEKQNLITLIAEKQSLIDKNNTALSALANDLADIRKKIEENKSEKEAKNLSMEEDLLNEKVTVFNNEIENIESVIKHSNERISAIDELTAQLDIAIDEVSKQCQGGIDSIKEEQNKVSIKRQGVAIKMESAVLGLYEKIRKWAGNTSVIAVYKNACGGCFIKLSDKSISDIKKGSEIIHCPHCGRILYDKEKLDETLSEKEQEKA